MERIIKTLIRLRGCVSGLRLRFSHITTRILMTRLKEFGTSTKRKSPSEHGEDPIIKDSEVDVLGI